MAVTPRLRWLIVSCLLLFFTTAPAFAVTLEELAARLERLEEENRELRAKVSRLESSQDTSQSGAASSVAARPIAMDGVLRIAPEYGYDMLDPTTRINRKQQYLLEQKQAGNLAPDTVVASGAVTAIANIQSSNTEGKFGYLMRHPTASNQVAESASEAVIHSAQLGLTANLGSWITGYAEVLYDPEQSFGGGTITALERNQLQLRRGYVMFGDLDEFPAYLSVGKMATPFGLTDTVSPFTASGLWHAFGGLAYGANLGYIRDGLSLSAMAVQGGAQFRSNNTPVDGTNVPSQLNNYVLDGNYTIDFGEDDSLLFGASYQRGSAYCQDFPVEHFEKCGEENPAWDVYGQLRLDRVLIHAEYAQTVNDWPGTFNPTIPEFAAHEVSSWNLGGKYTATMLERDVDLSVEFSRFVAGPAGAPWERQDQLVLGIATRVQPSVKLFAEYIHTAGYVPLNWISGGNLGDGVTHSVRDAESDIFVIGVQAAF